jgi:hypothetical protein
MALTDTIFKCKLEKRGDEIKKKSSLKLLSQSQPNFAEMILGWPPFKVCPSAPSCIQDGRHYFEIDSVVSEKNTFI